MAQTVFTCGRHRGKTYEEVANTDESFCQSVLRSNVESIYYPVEFKEYLLSRPLKEFSVGFFVEKMPKLMKAHYRSIIEPFTVQKERVHSKSTVEPDGNLGVFYRVFFSKCVSNIKNENTDIPILRRYASIFPFKIKAKLEKVETPIVQLFDRDFYTDICEFVGNHFEHSNYRELLDLFFSNVCYCRSEHFTPSSVKRLNNFVEKKIMGLNSLHVVYKEKSQVNIFLQKFPRLNRDGVNRYRILQKYYHQITQTKVEEHDEFGSKLHSYFRFLPEINFYELFSLLECRTFEENRSNYVDRLKKYLFFFGHAIKLGDHPVFFVDNLLFKCLEFLPTFEKPGHCSELTLWMMTLVKRRHQPLDGSKTFTWSPDQQNLQNVNDYVKRIANVDAALLNFEETNPLLQFEVLMLVDDVMYEICYSKHKRDFHRLIMKAALSSRDIRKLVFYNAYLGIENWMMVPPKKEEIKDFIRKYNVFNNFRPDTFIWYGAEKYYENIQ